ncbi:MAG TPA: hypothetical protein DFS52_21960, partial [Myxococcales bacterium]|nr:hypothetical protein [Myxococcales bacterium]
MKGRSLILPFLALALLACPSEPAEPVDPPAPGPYLGRHAHTLLRGSSDNAEAIKVVPGQKRAVLLSSKARKLTLLDVLDDKLQVAREKSLFESDSTESELTNLEVSASGTWAVLTRTLIETDNAGAQTACGGELVFVDVTDSDAFGTVLKQLEVGPMPDSVDISDDDTLVASANERDGPDAWGKCEVPGAEASVSIVKLEDGPASAVELHRVKMIDSTTGPREPEAVVFSKDGDLVAVTLQDSHEVALLSVSALALKANPTSDDVKIVELPPNALGAKPWPDGIARFEDAQGAERFAIAGEWNDTLIVIDREGEVLANAELSPNDLPDSLPRVVDPGSPLFSPDTIAPFVYGGRSYLAVSPRAPGA